jgi:hypothetical protein
MLGCVVRSGVCWPGCGAVPLLLGASVPGGGGTAETAHLQVCLGTPELQMSLWLLLSAWWCYLCARIMCSYILGSSFIDVGVVV